MHINTKSIALGGMLMAISVISIVLGSYVEFNTLVFLLLAAFLSGAVIFDMGLGVGTMYIAGTFVLGFFLSPQKMYALTYLGFAIYIFLVEAAYKWQQRLIVKNSELDMSGWKFIMWIYKFLIFNTIYLVCLFMMPEVILGSNILSKGGWVIAVAILAGQVVWIVLDKAYNYFIGHYWKNFIKRIR